MVVRADDTAVAYRWRWVGLIALLVAEAMNLLDTTIVQVAGPAIQAELGGSLSHVQWFTAAYTLAFAVLLITGGRLGDLAGRRRVFRLGVIGFGLTSLACALTGSAELLIVFRVLQGAAAAMIIPQTFGLIRAMFDGNELAKALGSIGPTMGLAGICGPLLGGVLTHADLVGTSWRAVFLVNLPLTALVLGIAPLLLNDRAPERPRLDGVGTILAMVGTALIVYPLIETGSEPWSARSGTLVAAGLVVLVGLGLQQRRSAKHGRRPLIELSLFAGRAFPAALATSILFFAVMNGLMMVIVLHMQLGLGADARTAGLTLLPWSVGMAVSSWTAGAYLVPRYGSRVLYSGLGVLILGLLAAIEAYRTTDPLTSPWGIAGALAVAGCGVGLFTTAFFTAALWPVSPQETGSAAGLLNAAQQLGSTLGVAILGSIYLTSVRPNAPVAAGSSVQHVFWIASVFLVGALLTASLMTMSRATDGRKRHRLSASDDVHDPS